MELEDLDKKTALEIGSLIDKGSLCPMELIEFYLHRINIEVETNSIFTSVLKKRSMELSKESKFRAKAGIRRSLIDGLPISIKDLADIKGEISQGGSNIIKKNKAYSDALFITHLISSGLIPLGKTHMTELAFSGLGLNPKTMTPKNSLDPNLVPGGSSSGSAISVAKNLSLASIGSDTGGSVRIPAAWNNLVGLKTTLNSVSLDGVLKLCPSFDTIGPICKNVEDADTLFSSLTQKKIRSLVPLKIPRLKFLVIKNIFFEQLNEDFKYCFDTHLEYLKKLGAVVEIKKIEEVSKVLDISQIVFPAEAFATWGRLIEENSGEVFQPVLDRFRTGRNTKAYDYLNGMNQLVKLREIFQKRTMGYDAILVPTCPIKPPNTKRLLEDFDFFTKQNFLALRNTRMANSLNLCSLTIPTKLNFSGLMLFCHQGKEEKLLRIGLSIQNEVCNRLK